MRLILTACLLALTSPACAAEGIFVWNDPNQMAIRMITFDSADPAAVTGVKTLTELTTQSATMTAVATDGAGIGLCRQERDGNEAPAWLTGYDRKGRVLWETYPRDLLAALESSLPKGVTTGHMDDPSWFTFECMDGGASGDAGVLAFDVGFGAGKLGADGFIRSDDMDDYVGRLHVSAKTGAVLAVGLVKKGKSSLVLQQNLKQPIYTDDNGQTYQMGNDAAILLPKGGRGRVLWGDRPFRWKGEPIVDGSDFAWFLPQSR